jgi:hypothetical protein
LLDVHVADFTMTVLILASLLLQHAPSLLLSAALLVRAATAHTRHSVNPLFKDATILHKLYCSPEYNVCFSRNWYSGAGPDKYVVCEVPSTVFVQCTKHVMRTSRWQWYCSVTCRACHLGRTPGPVCQDPPALLLAGGTRGLNLWVPPCIVECQS